MNASFLKGLLPHAIAVVIFIVIAAVYCQPALQGKVLSQTDIQQWKGMAQESYEFREKHGHFPIWSNSMFGGMPGYSFAFEPPSRMTIAYLHSLFTLGLPKPINFFFLASLMMYFLLMVLRIHPWIGIMGGLAYAYATYDPVIVAVGHDTKMICIAYAAGVIGSLLLIFRRHYLAGTILTAVFAGLIVAYSHLQVTYYTLLIALSLSVAFAIVHLKKTDWKHVLTSGGLALVAAVLAVAVNAVTLWPLNEYTKETMRGGRSELTPLEAGENRTVGGLDKDYAFEYSYGMTESFTVIVPNIFGGGSGGVQFKPGNSKFADKLTEMGQPEEAAFQMSNSLAYWGEQPILAGPVYLGAVICFLFILSFFFTRGWIKWAIVAVSAFGFVLAWGKNLAGVNYVLFDYLPLYNKFRAPSVALIIPQLGFVMLGCMAMHNILFGTVRRDEVWKRFRQACYVTGGIFALLVIMYLTLDYTGKNDAQYREYLTSQFLQQGQGQQPSPQMQQQAEEITRSLMSDLQDDRQGLFGKDLLRSLVFVLIAAGSFWLYLKNKMKLQWCLVIIALAGSIDLLAVGKRYLNNNNFQEEADVESYFIPTAADNQIKADPDQSFRVFDQTGGNPFADSRASYHHNSIGGYNAARLALFNDIIERQLRKGNMNVFNMMNTRYFIMPNPATRQPEARMNPDANGAAWFVRDIRMAKNADDEMRILDSLDTKQSAVVDQRYQKILGPQPGFDSAATIQLVENLNDKIIYKVNAPSNQFAVFSEIFYPYGWNAYIDGKYTDHARVNYVLRGMPVPAGNHTIEFRLEPRSVIVGDKITLWSCILVFILFAASIFIEVRKRIAGKEVLASNDASLY